MPGLFEVDVPKGEGTAFALEGDVAGVQGSGDFVFQAAVDVNQHFPAFADNLGTVPFAVWQFNDGVRVSPGFMRESRFGPGGDLHDCCATQAQDVAGVAGLELAFIGDRPHHVARLDALEYAAVGCGSDPAPFYMQGVVAVLAVSAEVSSPSIAA